jgi:hypothetical protein
MPQMRESNVYQGVYKRLKCGEICTISKRGLKMKRFRIKFSICAEFKGTKKQAEEFFTNVEDELGHFSKYFTTEGVDKSVVWLDDATDYAEVKKGGR